MGPARRGAARLSRPRPAGQRSRPLVEDSIKRVAWDLDNGFRPARAPHRLAAALGTLEAGQDKADLVALENDPVLREQATRAGAVVFGTVITVRQARATSSRATSRSTPTRT
jgi:hypothetical protein